MVYDANIKKIHERGKSKLQAYDRAQKDMAASERHTTVKMEESREAIKTGLGIIIANGQRFPEKEGKSIRMDVALTKLTPPELGALATTLNTFERIKACTLSGRYKQTFGRQQLVSCSCVVPKFVELCKKFDVQIPQHIQTWNADIQAKETATVQPGI